MKSRSSAELTFGLTLLVLVAFGAAVRPEAALAQGRGKQNFDSVKVEIQPVQGKVYLLTGAGGNTTVQAGPEGVLIVDTQFAPMAPKILAAIRQLTDKPIRYIINTHVHGDHTGANAALAQAAAPGVKIIAHENVVKVMSAPPAGRGQDFSAPKGNWPTETYKDTKTFDFNGEEIELIHVERAHSTGDTIVFFHGSNVVSAGDIYASSRFPSYDPTGSIDGMIAGLNRMIEIVTAPDKQGQGGTAIVPGHGRIAHQPELVAYRDMSVTIRDRVQKMISQGMTFEQVKAMQPMREYEPVYGGPGNGISSTNYVLEEIYNNLSAKK